MGEQTVNEEPITQADLVINAVSCEAARRALHMSRETLAREAGIGLRTLRRFELVEGNSLRSITAYKLQKALEAYGIEFAADGCGISWPREYVAAIYGEQ